MKGMEVLCEDGNFSQVSKPTPPSQIASSAPTGDAQVFEWRRSIINQVMEALRDDKINMVGICGMRGIGKTRMVREVVNKVTQEKLFKVVFVVVSQNANLVKIEGEIAQVLGLKPLVEDNLLARAEALRARILTSQKLLIVLDDVWDALDLNEVGIPIGDDHKGCKILLTSRNKFSRIAMNAQRIYQIPYLTEEEAWHLFKEKAGISNDHKYTDEAFQSTQKKVARECGGLPLAIVVVGSALKGKDEDSWNDALRQLREWESIGKTIEGVDSDVFSSLELSYNWLKEEEKESFLLCSLFEEDSNIPIENLVGYGFGLRLFKGIGRVDEARTRVKIAIDGLKRCHLLMDAMNRYYVIEHAMEGYVNMNCRDVEVFHLEWLVNINITEIRALLSPHGQRQKVFPMLKLLNLRGLKGFNGSICHQGQPLYKEVFSTLAKLYLADLPQVTHISDVACISSIEILSARYMLNLIEIWPNKQLEAYKLRQIYVGDCPKLNAIFLPSNLIECMPNLEVLDIDNCASVEVIFEVGELNGKAVDHPVLALPQLERLELTNLPKLTHVWAIKKSPGGGILQGSQILKFLTVGKCDSLRSLLSPSMAKLLVKLEHVSIVD